MDLNKVLRIINAVLSVNTKALNHRLSSTPLLSFIMMTRMARIFIAQESEYKIASQKCPGRAKEANLDKVFLTLEKKCSTVSDCVEPQEGLPALTSP